MMPSWGRRLGAIALCGAVLVTPAVTWLSSVGNPTDYLRYTLPPGQVPYVLSKLAGLLAFSLFWLQALLALSQGTPVQKLLPPLSYQAHRNLGMVTVVMALLHFGCFFSASLLRAGSSAWGLWVPQFTHGYYTLHRSLGLIALWLLALGAFAGWRRRRGGRAWRWTHRVWLAAFVLVVLHGFGIGSESRSGAMRYVSLFIVASLSVASLSRLYFSFNSRRAGSLDGMLRTEVSRAHE